ncbi:uncharacterized protein LOC126706790 [Quercus robur]|uniref:uncharacterized protein LOC126706790 n=1 Tax=Quercus robur TaxID=38942 RepID=UPI00216209FF|nr:uncharacterized protein LOC126706790 [Quercus robur]
MSKLHAPPRPLYKQHSWSPDIHRDEAWLRRKGSNKNSSGLRRNKSVSDDDLEELKACIELGFGFDSPEVDPKLSDTIPALEFFYAVNKQYSNSLSRSSSSSSLMASDTEIESPNIIIDQGEDAELVKTRLRQWAQVVACAVRQSSSTANGT